MSTAADRLVSRIRPELTKAAAAENLAAATAAAERALEILRPFAERAKKAKAVSRALPKPLPPGKTKAERKKTRAEIEAEGKRAARARAEQEGAPRCEWFTDGVRCPSYGSDCDHVLGGTHKGEMEDLPNGEGFQVECRTHHALKHGPGKDGHLAQAREHAIRIGSRALRKLVEKATALHEGKHGKVA
jgi:hypothetical protein